MDQLTQNKAFFPDFTSRLMSITLTFIIFKLILIRMQSKQAKLHNQSCHLLKVRRVSTYSHPSNGQKPLQQRVNQDTPRFSTKPKLPTEVFQKKADFVSSLIDKLKKVERHEILLNPCRQAILKMTEPRDSLKQKQKLKTEIVDKNKRQEIQNQPNAYQDGDKWVMFGTQQIKENKNRSLEQLELQNEILKRKVHELIIENERMKLRTNKFALQLNQKQVNFCKREKQLHKLSIELQQKQKELLNLQSSKYQQFPNKAHFQSLFDNFSKQIHIQHKLTISKQVNEAILPINNYMLAKAHQQIKQLRLQKLQLQKRFTKKLGQYRKKKEQQIQLMKKTFTSNLAHYKDLLLKVSFKIPVQLKKNQEDTFQTVILETSSAEQS